MNIESGQKGLLFLLFELTGHELYCGSNLCNIFVRALLIIHSLCKSLASKSLQRMVAVPRRYQRFNPGEIGFRREKYGLHATNNVPAT